MCTRAVRMRMNAPVACSSCLAARLGRGSGLVGRLLDLLGELVRELVPVVDINRVLDDLIGEVRGRHGQSAESALEVDVLVSGLECLDGAVDEAGDALGGLRARARGRGGLRAFQGVADGATQLVRHGVLVVDVGGEVEDLQAGRGQALQGLGDVVILLPGEVGARGEESTPDPNAAHEEADHAADHARSSDLVLLSDLHQSHRPHLRAQGHTAAQAARGGARRQEGDGRGKEQGGHHEACEPGRRARHLSVKTKKKEGARWIATKKDAAPTVGDGKTT
mmetsp:Transcript_1609/g.4091  ORF Transcript_1609/g.4091 Transcript_1609/m.4091 type:complete len:279 (-) Transcript_1609:16-852(-)